MRRYYRVRKSNYFLILFACNTVIDSSERTVGYDVKYLIGDTLGEVRMDHDPGDTIPLEDGKLSISRGPTFSGS